MARSNSIANVSKQRNTNTSISPFLRNPTTVWGEGNSRQIHSQLPRNGNRINLHLGILQLLLKDRCIKRDQ